MSKTFRNATLLATLTLFAAAGGALATDAPSLYVLDDTPRPPVKGWQAIEDAVEEYHVATDPKVVAMNPEAIRLAIPYGPELEAVRSRFVDYGAEWKSWFGTLRPAGVADAGDGFVYLGYHGDRVTGILHYGGERYQIAGGVGGPQRLVRQSDELADTPNCGLHLGTDAKPLGAVAGKPARKTVSTDPAVLFKASTRIDVMALYPDDYFAFPTSQITLIDFVEDSIALANDAFTNSNVSAYYNVVHIGPIVEDQPASNGLQGALDLLNDELSEISTLRDAFGADVVTMFVPFGWTATNACGVANMPVRRNSDNGLDYVAGVAGLQGSPLGDNAYSANRHSCGLDDITLGHEIGHNYGMWHDTAPSGWQLLSSDARGYLFTVSGSPKATVMGCNCTSGCTAGTAAVCNRVAHFSDPNINYQGVPTGTSTRRNANLGRSSVGTYAAFRPQSSNTPPVASFTVSCNSSTRKCDFDASGTTDNGSITKYTWYFGDGTGIVTTTSPTISHTYGGSGTFYWVHLLATDNGNQRDLAIQTATF